MSDTLQNQARTVIAHGMMVLFVGLVAGVMLVFSLLDAVALWPFPAIAAEIPGSTRGWQAAHVGGIVNGVMMAAIGMLMTYLNLEGATRRWTYLGAIIMGWGNTVFYWAGNFAPNRGLSAGDTPYGPGDLAGVLAYLGGGIAMVVTFVFVFMLIRAALKRH